MNVNFVFYECQGIDRNNESLLVGKSVAFRPNDKHVDLDLIWLDVETFTDIYLELWSILKMI